MTNLITPDQINDSDLLQIHKILFRKLINENIPSLKNKRILYRLYDSQITKDNIRKFYNHHITLFTKALIQGELELIENI